MLKITKDWGEHWEKIPAHWSTYIAVDDCDATAEKIKTNGGKINHGPFDAPNVGRIAMVCDPSGANFCVIQFKKG
jgi:predicted enzyme related to lactoylglutathione lyase